MGENGHFSRIFLDFGWVAKEILQHLSVKSNASASDLGRPFVLIPGISFLLEVVCRDLTLERGGGAGVWHLHVTVACL